MIVCINKSYEEKNNENMKTTLHGYTEVIVSTTVHTTSLN